MHIPAHDEPAINASVVEVPTTIIVIINPQSEGRRRDTEFKSQLL